MTEAIQIKQTLETSSTIGEIVKALAVAKLNFGIVKKTSNNPYYKSKYADLEEILSAVTQPLAEQGIAIIQMPSTDLMAKEVSVITCIAHSSGEYFKGTTNGPAEQKSDKGSKFDIQTVGSAISYLRRYAVQSILSLAAEDDDGNSISQGTKEPAKPLQINAFKEAVKQIPVKISPESELKQPSTTDADGCPVNDEDVPAELRLPTKEVLKGLVERLKALGEDRRLCRQWLEAQSGKEYAQTPLVQFEKLLKQLESAKQDGKLNDLIQPKV